MKNSQATGATALKNFAPEESERLQALYTFREPAKVTRFLEQYPFLIPLLLEAPEQIRIYFPGSPLFLQYLPDPEIDYPLLVLYVGTNLEPEEAVERLDQLDDWWVEVPNRDRGKLCIDVEFE